MCHYEIGSRPASGDLGQNRATVNLLRPPARKSPVSNKSVVRGRRFLTATSVAMEDPKPTPVDIATWTGRTQAFAIVARQCSAAQAECLRQIHDSGSYTSLSPTWDDFCRDYAGMSRPKVDSLIRTLEEFGPDYFRFSEIARVSPDTYRQLAPAIASSALEFEGESIPLTPENAPKIRRAVQQLRADLKQSRQRESARLSITVLQAGFDSLFRDMTRLIDDIPARACSTELHGLAHYCINHLNRIDRAIPKP